jgi:hypothetical protein
LRFTHQSSFWRCLFCSATPLRRTSTPLLHSIQSP